MKNRGFIRNKNGFTVIELMIATSVFSIILLLATTGIINVGKLYFKEINTSKTQEAVRNVIDEISRSLQLTGGSYLTSDSGNNEDGNYHSFCIGEDRYTYRINRQLTVADPNGHALWFDKLPAGSACNPSNFTVPGGRELLSNNMRLFQLNVAYAGLDNNTFSVDVRIVYGDNDLLTPYDDNNVFIPGSVLKDANCKSGISGSSFCAVASLQTIIKRRVP